MGFSFINPSLKVHSTDLKSKLQSVPRGLENLKYLQSYYSRKRKKWNRKENAQQVNEAALVSLSAQQYIKI